SARRRHRGKGRLRDKLPTDAANSRWRADPAPLCGRTHASVWICKAGRPVRHYRRYTIGCGIAQAMVWTEHSAFDPDSRTLREESLREPIDSMRGFPHRDIISCPTDFGSAGCRL